jgi:hypothetical protein
LEIHPGINQDHSRRPRFTAYSSSRCLAEHPAAGALCEESGPAWPVSGAADFRKVELPRLLPAPAPACPCYAICRFGTMMEEGRECDSVVQERLRAGLSFGNVTGLRRRGIPSFTTDAEQHPGRDREDRRLARQRWLRPPCAGNRGLPAVQTMLFPRTWDTAWPMHTFGTTTVGGD